MGPYGIIYTVRTTSLQYDSKILEDGDNKLNINSLVGSDSQKHLDWLARLRVAEDAAKGGY